MNYIMIQQSKHMGLKKQSLPNKNNMKWSVFPAFGLSHMHMLFLNKYTNENIELTWRDVY